MSTVSTIEESLVKATEHEYHWPALQQLHNEALERIRAIGLPSQMFSVVITRYYDRIEAGLPSLRWQVGRSKFEARVLMITEEMKEKEWKELGYDGLREATPTARIIANALLNLWHQENNKENVPIVPFPWSYVEVPGGGRFLRARIADRVIEHEETYVKTHFVSYLRFFLNSLPRPHGKGEVVAI